MAVTEGTYTLRFSHADYLPATTPNVTVLPGAQRHIDEVALALNPAKVVGHVEAELVAGRTAPLAQAIVTLDGTGITGVTDPNGDFTLTNIPAGSYVVRALGTGYESQTQAALSLKGGEVRHLPESFSLKLSRGGVSGTIALSDSGDASGALVQIAGPSLASTITAAADGKYTFSGLLTGVYSVKASKAGYQTQTIQPALTVGANAVAAAGAATLHPDPATLLGHVSGENTSSGTDPLQGATITLDGVGAKWHT